MSAPELLVVIDPVARATDGESVRIARDVLCAGARDAKVCVPDCAAEVERVLAKRGDRQPVVVGDDRALLRTVRLLHRERELAVCPLSVVPVGPADSTVLVRSLGVPGGPVEASRTALTGTTRAMDLLVDDSGGVVLGDLRVPARSGPASLGCPDVRHGAGGQTPPGRGWAAAPPEVLDDGTARDGAEPAGHPVSGGPGADRVPPLRGCRSLVRSLARPLPLLGALAGGASHAGVQAVHRLRVEADGAMLADLDRPVAGVSVAPAGEGLAVVTVRRRASSDPVQARARTVTVSGPDFRYRADAVVGGPVRARTWTVLDAAWRLTLPAAPGGAGGTDRVSGAPPP